VRIGASLPSPSLVSHHITVLPRVICAAPSYLKTNGIPHEPSELKKHSCLHYGYLSTGCQWQLSDRDKEERVTIDGAFCSNNGEVLRDAAVKGVGIVMLPTFIVERELERGELEIILSNYHPTELTLCVIYPVNRHLSTKVRLFTQFLQECYEQ
jgi:DNA-binding transcriptional LysR family regulator